MCEVSYAAQLVPSDLVFGAPHEVEDELDDVLVDVLFVLEVEGLGVFDEDVLVDPTLPILVNEPSALAV